MNTIVEVQPEPEYKVWLRFEDGVEGEADLSVLVGRGVLKAWEEPGAFFKVFIDPETDTIAWPGGIDLCPDSLYADMTGVPFV
jgi:hypothetical protein